MQRDYRNEKIDLVKKLLDEPESFSFIQAIRILSKKLGNEYFKKIIIKPHLSLSFPPTDIVSIDYHDGIYEITVTFFGLYGASSPLPTFYTEELIEEKNNDKSIKRDFIDIFNKRIYEFYYLSWLKSHPGIQIYEYKNKNMLLILNALKAIAAYPLSAEFLQYFFRINRFEVTIKEFVKNETEINKNQLCEIGIKNNTLGKDSHIGYKLTNYNKFSIVLMNMNKRKFMQFLEKKEIFENLIKHLMKSAMVWDYEIRFKKQQNFSLGEMEIGVNAVVGNTDNLIIKDIK
ncbi:type VI secretion system baseplate subunit TssG [Nautilia lithotrophica]